MSYFKNKYNGSFLVFNRSFTMIELIVVMLIISIMASFGIPNFTKAVARAKARDAVHNITIIHAAQSLYKARNSVYITAADLTEINGFLSLNLIANDSTAYMCTTATCVATASAASGGADNFKVTGTLDSSIGSGNPACTTTSGNCP